jgi:hypothetical protein
MSTGELVYAVNEHLKLTFWAMPGEGRLGAVSVQHALVSRDDGNFCKEFGLGGSLKGQQLEITTRLVKLPAIDRACVTYVLYQSFPDRPDSPDNRQHQRRFGPFWVSFAEGQHEQSVSHTISLI